MTYHVRDVAYPNKLFLYNDFDIQFKNFYADVPPEVAYKMNRTQENDYEIKDTTPVPFNPKSWTEDRRLIWFCNVGISNGFGHVAEQTIKNLIAKDYNVLNPGCVAGGIPHGGEYVDKSVLTSLNKDIYPDCLEIQHCQPPAFKKGIIERSWIYSMYETTNTPKSWIKILNEAERVLVPSKWLVDNWKELGVTRPIDVYGHGVDMEVYYYMERPERPTYTFLHFCQLSNRKGSELVAKAFVDEFKNNTDVRLIAKNTYPIFTFPGNLPNVTYISATYDRDQMRELMFNADCFVFPTRGEGFGLPPLEAMATGLPSIVTGWSGTTDFIDKEDTLILDYKMTRATEFDYLYRKFYDKGENAGYWAEPDYEQLRYYMRWCYENRIKAKEMGKKAAERIKREWRWSQKINDLIGIIDRNI